MEGYGFQHHTRGVAPRTPVEPVPVPPCLRDMDDGIMVTVDFRKDPSTVAVKSPEEVLHGDGSDGLGGALAGFFITMRDAASLAQSIREGKPTASVRIPSAHAGGSASCCYSHAVLTCTLLPSSVRAEDCVRVTIEAVAAAVGAEVAPQSATREYTAVIRTHSSHIIEQQGFKDAMYLHGMRKAVSLIGWGLCRCPPCNCDIPIVPPNMSVGECVRVLQAMQLEVGVPTESPGGEAEWRAMSRRAGPSNEELGNEQTALHVRVREAVQRSEGMAMIGIQELPAIGARRGGCEEEDRVSIFPMGMVTTRHVGLVPGAPKAIAFMRRESTAERFPREVAGRAILGAFNCFHAEGHLEKCAGLPPRERSCTQRTHFLEDIECDEMHALATLVMNRLAARHPTKSICMSWSGIPIHLWAVKVAPGVGVFAFCREGVARPFALSGMRYEVYSHLGRFAGCCRGVYQYPLPREDMVEELARQVSPRLSDLNHRERFALQQSFVVHACTLHRGEFGPHKRLLRNLVMEWYQRRVQRNAPSVDGLQVPDGDICFMRMAMHATAKDVAPHWWFAASVH